MSINKISEIRIMFNDDIFEFDSTVDVKASKNKFITLITDALKERYPNVNVIIKNGYGTIWVDSEKEHTEIRCVEQIIHNVWSKFNWIVY